MSFPVFLGYQVPCTCPVQEVYITCFIVKRQIFIGCDMAPQEKSLQFWSKAVSEQPGNPGVNRSQSDHRTMALVNLRNNYLVCKYQHWGSRRYHEYLVLEESGHLGFFRHTRKGYRELAWQGCWRGNGDSSSSRRGFQIEVRDFGCCPGVRLWHLNFTQDYGWRFTCTDGSRSFLPLMVVNSNRDDMRPWMMALDTLATISGATTQP